MRRIRPLAILAALLLMACSTPPGRDGPEGEVFTVATGFSQGGSATTVDVIDVGLPTLHNSSGQSVRLRWVRFASPPKTLRVVGIYAYLYSVIGGGIGGGTGDLPKYCGPRFKPHPLTDVVTAPHSDSNWTVIFAFTIRKPGHYNLGRAKIGYTTDGQRGWQFQNLNTTLVISAAKPGTKPVLTGC